MKQLRMREISRALARHDPVAVYTLLRERLDQEPAGEALLALIRTVPGWDPPDGEHERARTLTRRELEVLRCASEGLSVRGTAQRLYLSPNTIGSHRFKALHKLDAHTIGEAVSIARADGLIP